MDSKQKTNAGKERDLLGNTGSFLRLWGLPVAVIILSSMGAKQGWLSLSVALIFWSLAVAWIGVHCYLHGRRCQRVHCKILGYTFPIIGGLGILVAVGFISIAWGILELAFFVALIVSFIPEFLGLKYFDGNKLRR